VVFRVAATLVEPPRPSRRPAAISSGRTTRVVAYRLNELSSVDAQAQFAQFAHFPVTMRRSMSRHPFS
jgi:hypothetical protein